MIAMAIVRSEEWRIALERTFLSNRPYTTLDVKPGTLMVDEGQSVAIAVSLTGRTPREVVLQTHTDGQSADAWTTAPLKGKPGKPPRGETGKGHEAFELPGRCRIHDEPDL